MKPRIDIDIRDYEGKSAELQDANTFEPFEIYLNDERIFTSEKVEELESENDELRKLVRKAHACKTDDGCCEDCYQDEGCCPIERDMQGLGIEVE